MYHLRPLCFCGVNVYEIHLTIRLLFHNVRKQVSPVTPHMIGTNQYPLLYGHYILKMLKD